MKKTAKVFVKNDIILMVENILLTSSFNAARYSFHMFLGQHFLKKPHYLMTCEVRFAVV